MINTKEYYVQAYEKLYAECLIQAEKYGANDVTAGANDLFEDCATADAVVGYYLIVYDDNPLQNWLDNLKFYLNKGKEETATDREVTRILMELFNVRSML